MLNLINYNWLVGLIVTLTSDERLDVIMMYDAITPKFRRPVVQVLIVRVDIGVLTYEALTPQFGRSLVQVLVVR